MTIEQNDDAQMSEEDYWAQIKAYNADGSYLYPPPAINADQVFDFWLHVPVPDHVLSCVRERDIERREEMERQVRALHTGLRFYMKRSLLHGQVQHFLPSLSPQHLQRELDTLAKQRRFRKHPELLAEHQVAKDLQLALQRTAEIRATVPPCLISTDQLRMAARLGRLMIFSSGLQETERAALWGFEVVFMGERQTIRGVYDRWRPDLIV